MKPQLLLMQAYTNTNTHILLHKCHIILCEVPEDIMHICIGA